EGCVCQSAGGARHRAGPGAGGLAPGKEGPVPCTVQRIRRGDAPHRAAAGTVGDRGPVAARHHRGARPASASLVGGRLGPRRWPEACRASRCTGSVLARRCGPHRPRVRRGHRHAPALRSLGGPGALPGLRRRVRRGRPRDASRRRSPRARSGRTGGWRMNALVLSAVLAATPITLQQVREESRNNLQALLGELDRVRASEQKRFSTGALMPQVQLQAQAGRTIQQDYRDIGTVVVLGPDGVPVQPLQYRQAVTDFPAYAANRFQLGATLNQVIFDLAKFQVLAQNGHLEAAARGTAAEQVLASEFEAVRRFYALWTAQKQLLVLQATADRSKEFSDRAGALFEAGRGTKGDALAAQVNLGTDRINVEKQRAVVSQAQIDLASWLGRSEGQELDAVDPALPETPPPPSVNL